MPRATTARLIKTLAAASLIGLLAGCQPPPAPANATPLPDEEATALMYALSEGEGPAEARRALDAVVQSGDQRFVAVLIELLRFNQLDVVAGAGFEAHVEALERLSGEHFGGDWPAWVEWYGATDLTPPPGFTTWKGELLARIDPQFAEFLRDEYPSRIRAEEIQWGGVAVDGIPPLDYPQHVRPEEATYLSPEDAVFGIAVGDEARAYPLRIVDWHEMVNDVIAGQFFSLAYCTLCGAAIPYVGRTADTIYTFGTSGLLYRSNKLMYDRQTHTLWNQLTGEPALGALADSDLQLEFLPVVLTTWADWLEQHPETYVLSLDTGYQRPYETGAAYGDYFASPDTMFPVWQRSDLLDDKAQVYALTLDGVPRAYPVEALAQAGVVNDTVGETAVVLVAGRGTVTVRGASRFGGEVNYSSGAEVRAYERGDHSFSPGPTPDRVIDEEDREWQVTEEALIGPGGEMAPRVSGHLAYWFGWYAMFPQTQVYGTD
jgi:hypothetical protein